jgi:hypothetical protein
MVLMEVPLWTPPVTRHAYDGATAGFAVPGLSYERTSQPGRHILDRRQFLVTLLDSAQTPFYSRFRSQLSRMSGLCCTGSLAED